MKLRVRQNKLYILFTLTFFLGCVKNTQTSYYEKTAHQWRKYISKISDQGDISLNNTILLVLKSSECNSALVELKRWDKFYESNDIVNVKLIIMEKYASTVQVFLNHENIDLPFYQDSAYVLIKERLLPTTPMKVYFDNKGIIKKLSAIGGNNDVSEFVNDI